MPILASAQRTRLRPGLEGRAGNRERLVTKGTANRNPAGGLTGHRTANREFAGTDPRAVPVYCLLRRFAVLSQDVLSRDAPTTAQTSRVLYRRTHTLMASLDWSQCPVVESIPGKVSGTWVFRGTRVPVSAIFENLKCSSVDEVLENFHATREQVRAVLDFAAKSAVPPAEPLCAA